MKNPERVAELLAALKAECEFNFEFVALANFKETLQSELPAVEIIDDRHQKFLGITYGKRKKDGHYFHGGKGIALHRAVWQHFFGTIPKGYVIHHVDHNKDNNALPNLRLMSITEHVRHHNSNVCRAEKKTFVCQMCGREYEGYNVGKNRFCSQACIQKNYALNHLITKTCPFCGKEFVTRHKKTKYCSSTCASRAYRQRRREKH